jgi:hypothetical protein
MGYVFGSLFIRFQTENDLAVSGRLIMRIHGTFVNFPDLSPAIQEDIILRLDLESTPSA